MSQPVDVSDIIPSNYNLPQTHAVQALNGRYIRADILYAALEKTWSKNWHVVVGNCNRDSDGPKTDEIVSDTARSSHSHNSTKFDPGAPSGLMHKFIQHDKRS